MGMQRSGASIMASMDPAERNELLSRFTPQQLRALRYKWEGFLARPDQEEPPGDWDIWLILAGRGWGKCLALDTEIPTPDGWTTMGAIEPGDRVFDMNGRIVSVEQVHPIVTPPQCYRLAFEDGAEIDACSEHLWVTKTADERRTQSDHRIRDTAEIARTLKINARADSNHSVAVTEPLDLPFADLSVPPYTLGAMLGDGIVNPGRIVTPDAGVLRMIELDGYETALIPHPVYEDSPAKLYRVSGVRRDLKKVGIFCADDKHIPEEYMRASFDQRLALLQGLMDTDGTAENGGKSRVGFYNSRESLVKQVGELAASLGMKPHYGVSRAFHPKDRTREVKPSHHVRFSPTIVPFALKRKADACTAPGPKSGRRMIVSVDPVPSVPMRCISVSGETSTYLVHRNMIPTHNTRTGAEWVKKNVEAGKARNIALVAATDGEALDVMIHGVSGIMKVYEHEPASKAPKIHKDTVVWPNGAVARPYSSWNPEALRGPNFDAAWSDEVGKWKYARPTWDMLQFALREQTAKGGQTRQIVTTTPRPTELVKAIAAGDEGKVHRTNGRTKDNAANLDKRYAERIYAKYSGTRLGRQELDGVILSDLPNSLWTYANLEAYRIAHKPDDIGRTLVAIDPATGGLGDQKARSAETAERDEHGIVIGGLGADGTGYLLEDRSCHGTPNEWAKVAIKAYDDYKADAVVIEVTQGGAMATNTLRTLRPDIPIRKVFATRGKHVRAEPVASLYEQGRIRHVGTFPAVEDQLVLMTTMGYQGERSPDRLDAVVWLFSALLPDLIEIPDPDKVSKRERMLRTARESHAQSRA